MQRFVVSDIHMFHKNIIKYCNRPENYLELILSNWKKQVKPDDEVYDLGDVIFEQPELLKDILNCLPGKKILIKGNHDKKSSTWYTKNGYSLVLDGAIVNGILLTHKPTNVPAGLLGNVHGHLHNLGYDNVKAFGETYTKFLNTKHILYSPELENYRLVDLSKYIGILRGVQNA